MECHGPGIEEPLLLALGYWLVCCGQVETASGSAYMTPSPIKASLNYAALGLF